MQGQYHSSWDPVLAPLLRQDYMRRLANFLSLERTQGLVFPPRKLVFNAFEQTPLTKVKVVILGQDPYHDHGQAHGMA
ncbi:MAG: uracil-DNA glycosylase, partial [Sphingobacterium sp.]